MTSSAACLATTIPDRQHKTTAPRVSLRHVSSARCNLHTPLHGSSGLQPVSRVTEAGWRSTSSHRRMLKPCLAKRADQDELTPYEKKVLEKRRQIQAEYQGDPSAYVTRRNRERDLYSDQWDGDKWKGSKLNGLTVITVISILAPVIGLLVAYFTYGSLWG